MSAEEWNELSNHCVDYFKAPKNLKEVQKTFKEDLNYHNLSQFVKRGSERSPVARLSMKQLSYSKVADFE